MKLGKFVLMVQKYCMLDVCNISLSFLLAQIKKFMILINFA